MQRLILPITLILASVGVFFFYIQPTYEDITALRQEAGRLDQALSKARELQTMRDQLLSRFNALDPEDLARLQKMLPDNIDNVRLILDIDNIAAAYGLQIRDFGISESAPGTSPSDGAQQQGSDEESAGATQQAAGGQSGAAHRSVVMDFSVQATYDEFLNFARDLERSLRLVDITSISLAGGGGATEEGAEPQYGFGVSLRTYWLP